MARFNFHDYEELPEGKLLRIKLKDSDEWLYVVDVSRSALQAYLPGFTTVTKINFKVIKDQNAYKENPDEFDNFYEVKAQPEEVVQYELVEI